MEFQHETRGIRLNTALGPTALGFRSMTMREGISQLFEIEVEALSETADVDFEALLGRNLTVALDTEAGEPRYFNAFVSRARLLGAVERVYGVRLTCAPWLWFLTLSQNCRIFADKNVRDIVSEVLDQHAMGDYEFRLDREYPTYEYYVQYNETDYDFISRVLEREGVAFYFEHENGSHRLVFVDSMSRYAPYAGYDTFRYEPAGHVSGIQEEAVMDWLPEKQVLTTRVALRDFNFETPKADLNADSNVSRQHAISEMEVFEYPGLYRNRSDGTTYAKTRVEALQSAYSLVRAGGTLRGVVSGCRFRLEDHPVDAFNSEYLVLSVEHRMTGAPFESGRESTESYECSFTAMPIEETFRPPRVTPWPRIRGPQTAMVVGTEGEEIDPDEYGRVKVRFHWSPGDSSCWIRVTQVWTGPNWGALSIPRIGEEVIVEFEDGDPDRPIITGRVYNANAMPPYDPPSEPTVTTFKTNSSKGGGGFNELRFDDKKGEENLFIHAQKDMDTWVRNTSRKNIGNERHVMVDKSQTKEVGEDSFETVGMSHYQDVGMECHSTVGLDAFESVGMTYHLDAGMDSLLTAQMNTVVNAGMTIHLKAGMMVVLDAGAGISLKSGGSFVTINPGGVFIQGPMVGINSGGGPLSGPGTKAGKATKPDEAKAAKTSKAGDVAEKAPKWTRRVSPTELDSNLASRALRNAQGGSAPFVDNAGGGGGATGGSGGSGGGGLGGGSGGGGSG